MSYSNSELQDLVEGERLDDFWRGGEGVQSQILKYLWVATFPCGGFGGPPPKKI